MRKEITIAAVTIFLTAAPVFAQSTHANQGNDNEGVHANIQNSTIHSFKTDADDLKITPVVPTGSLTPSGVPCVGDDDNHGKFVSCIAHMHPGGKDVSDAARDKDDNDNNNTITPTTVPTVSVSVTPTTAPSITPSTSPLPSTVPSVSPSPTASASPTPGITSLDTFHGEVPFSNFQTIIGKLFNLLEHWL